MGGPDAVAGFRASLSDLRKLFSQTSEAADNAQKAQQAREASDAEAVREGAKALELEARREALENALKDARKDAKAQKGRADAAEAALKKLQAQAKPEAKGTTERLTAENERLRKFLRELKARLASANEEKKKAEEAAEAKGVARGIEKGKSELDEAVKEAEARGKAQGLDEGRAEAEAVDDVDEKVQEAIKRAEVEAKAKQDKVLDIKRLNGSIGSIRSELNKYEEQLEDCKKYKAFLDRLTPQEWFQDLIERKRLQVQERKAEHERVVAEIRQTKAEAQAKKTKADEDLANAGTQQEAEAAEMNVLKLTELLEEAMQLKEPQVPESWDDPDDQEEPMYFKNPQQLLDIFDQLEEQNLFLIQNVQERPRRLWKSSRTSALTRRDGAATACSGAADLSAPRIPPSLLSGLGVCASGSVGLWV